MTRPLPRLMIAAPASGHGKTTVAAGLMAALRADGLEVAGFKVGPDYIDPGYHALATGRPGRNLDPVLCGPERLAPLLLHGAGTPTQADVAVVEGVMGLFDGQLGGGGFGSTAHVARLLQTPIVLVVDVSAVSRTAAAVVHGLDTFEPGTRLSGVVLNKTGSKRHVQEVRTALEATGLPVLGVIPRDAGLEVPSRHLGLVPAGERERAADTVRLLGRRLAEHVSLADLLAVAATAPALDAEPWTPASAIGPPSDRRPVVAVAGGRAFTFRYPETDELLRAAGCPPMVFDPLRDERLPAGTAGLYLGGGFPEVHARDLSANTGLRADIAGAIAAGLPTVAECAGLLYLCRSIDGVPMVGAVDVEASMTGRLTLGYRTAVADHDHLLARSGTRVSGHEFHRTVVGLPAGSRPAAWLVDGNPEGLGTSSLHASYLHTHWAGEPGLASRFAAAVHGYAASGRSWRPGPVVIQGDDHDLGHHGDDDLGDGLVDLAVNVRLPAPPDWLVGLVNESTARLAAYPRPDAATAAIAAAHGVAQAEVLPTAGAVEAFTLLARALRPTRALVVHPQFTEPEAALRRAAHRTDRLLLGAEDGFVLDVDRVPDEADLIMIGNPTNPTGVLHPASVIRALVRPGRVVCVDEAFMDAVPGEPESLLADADLTGVVVIRSLTKTWGLAGLRAGYAVGDRALIAALRTQQPRWSVSTPALAAIVACLSPSARCESEAAAVELERRRALLVGELRAVGLAVAGEPRTPFVLVDARSWELGREAGTLRRQLRERGFAVRRGETFPGLSAGWLRIAVRDEEITESLAKTLHAIREAW